MTRVEPLVQATGADSENSGSMQTGTGQEPFRHGDSLRDAVTVAVGHYLKELDGQMPTDVYPMVLAEMEEPLLAQIMAYTRNNQTKASIMLGLNRGTLRKKLKQYKLIPSDQD
jgi:Fis family transcriptional regulator, factor for inversion stimulation protein